MSPDSHIRLLPIHVANKIAAGEVVERPASVVKELVENAIDALATRIDITISAGGRKLVAVRDNGCGMSREDALMALERQATSKIRDVDDIEKISTLGFRGEAIPSIAAVSRFTMITRRLDAEEGTQLVVNAGTIAEVTTCGAPPGTTIEVRDLFCNVPARRKFLRAYATEESRIREAFTTIALAHPKLGFSLTVDGREVKRLPCDATTEERIADLFGEEYLDSLVCINDIQGETSVHGFVEVPDRRISVRHGQYIFTNGRPATASAVSYALREGYPKHPGDDRPSVILFIKVPPSAVDVNVHPAKREVRFRNPGEVRDTILTALAHAFSSSLVAAPISVPPAAEVAPLPPKLSSEFAVPFSTPVRPYSPAVPTRDSTQHEIEIVPSAPASSESVAPAPAASAPVSSESVAPAPAASAPVTPAPVTPAPILERDPLITAQGPWQWFKFLAMTDSGYLLLETDAGLVTLNPTAARERIAFEALLHTTGNISQPLLIPETIHLSPTDSARLKRFVDILQSQGFELSEFGPDTWKVDAVPQLLGGIEASRILTSIAYDIDEAGSRQGSEKWREELIAKSVARTYAGSSAKMTPESAVKLVEELAACRMPYVCPRGKPIMIFMSNRELKRKFSL